MFFCYKIARRPDNFVFNPLPVVKPTRFYDQSNQKVLKRQVRQKKIENEYGQPFGKLFENSHVIRRIFVFSDEGA